VEAAEKRLVRTGYDLHDGPLQDVVGLAEELRLLAADLEPLVPETSRASVQQGLDSVREQVCRLGEDLRDVAQSLETSAASRQSLEQLFSRAAASLTRRTEIECSLDVRGDLTGLTDSQRITLYRVVQEALANVGEHSGASSVAIRLTGTGNGVTLTISDDGHGFDPSLRVDAAIGHGRLGLVGMSERVRLLGGLFRLTSAPGRGTTVRVVLSRWAPPAEDGRSPGYFS
jgi:signal transduction histidine kinase